MPGRRPRASETRVGTETWLFAAEGESSCEICGRASASASRRAARQRTQPRAAAPGSTVAGILARFISTIPGARLLSSSTLHG